MGNGHSSRSVLTLGALLIGAVMGCSNSDPAHGASGASGDNPSAGASGSGSGISGSSSSAGANSSGFPDDDGVYVGASGDIASKLPPLPALGNVVARLNDDSAKITFDPLDGALDYRVYALPNDTDIDVKADGQVVIKNGTYRCAGNRESPQPSIDDQKTVPGAAIRTQVDNQMVGGYLRKLADATLGYVSVGAGPGLVPVYVLGEPDGNADATCFFNRWAASRTKKYTTSKDERERLLAASFRDDGIAFYVPSEASATTKQIFEAGDQAGTPFQARFYVADGPEANAHSMKSAAFLVDTESGPNRQPLMRVYYGNQCGWSHDELAVGKERFLRIRQQGDQLPWWSLLWTGISAPTTLVVEALSSGCPYQGHLSPVSFPSLTATFGSLKFVHEPYVTLEQARAASPSTELFINGQRGPAWIWEAEKLTNGMQPASQPVPLPKAIARSFLKVRPNAHPKMDFFADFSATSTPEVFTKTPCAAAGDCPVSQRTTSATFDQMFTEIEGTSAVPLSAFGPVHGELWVTFADNGADTNGKFRLTANQKATMDASAYLHVTMEADAYSTARRYPQILISDQDVPVQFRLDKGHTIIVQTRAAIGESIDWPVNYEIELCKLRKWDVNDQCPAYDLHHIPGKDGGPPRLAPNAEVGELASADQRVIFDAYASTKRVYLFLDGKPYACAELPAGAAPLGPVTITWGDVLYHSAVDHLFSYHAAHLQIDTSRHFDNLGFSSGVPAPGWDESRLPCVAPITL